MGLLCCLRSASTGGPGCWYDNPSVSPQPGLATQMLTAAEERPWLWVVYVLTVALPLVLIVVFCCTGKVRQRTARTHAQQIDTRSTAHNR